MGAVRADKVYRKPFFDWHPPQDGAHGVQLRRSAVLPQHDLEECYTYIVQCMACCLRRGLEVTSGRKAEFGGRAG